MFAFLNLAPDPAPILLKSMISCIFKNVDNSIEICCRLNLLPDTVEDTDEDTVEDMEGRGTRDAGRREAFFASLP